MNLGPCFYTTHTKKGFQTDYRPNVHKQLNNDVSKNKAWKNIFINLELTKIKQETKRITILKKLLIRYRVKGSGPSCPGL